MDGEDVGFVIAVEEARVGGPQLGFVGVAFYFGDGGDPVFFEEEEVELVASAVAAERGGYWGEGYGDVHG